MTDNILDVLTYMFDYLFEEAEQDGAHEINDIELKEHLSDAGFDIQGINKALSWLENIAALQDGKVKPLAATSGSVRIYNHDEKMKLGTKCRGFLLFMENAGQLDSAQREMVIDQVMSLGNGSIALEDLKWVMMMVLGNSNHNEMSPDWLESIVFLDEHKALQ